MPTFSTTCSITAMAMWISSLTTATRHLHPSIPPGIGIHGHGVPPGHGHGTGVRHGLGDRRGAGAGTGVRVGHGVLHGVGDHPGAGARRGDGDPIGDGAPAGVPAVQDTMPITVLTETDPTDPEPAGHPTRVPAETIMADPAQAVDLSAEATASAVA